MSKEDKLPNAVEPWHSRWVELRAQLDAVIEWMDEREGEAEEHADAEAWGLVKAGIDRAFRDGQDVLPLQIPADRCPADGCSLPAGHDGPHEVMDDSGEIADFEILSGEWGPD